MRVHDEFKHYRSSGVSLAVFLITLNGAILVWMKGILNNPAWPKDAPTAMLAAIILIAALLSVLTSVWAQYAQFQGYKHRANGSFAGLVGNGSLQNVYGRLANKWFGQLDNYISVSVWSFVTAAVFAVLVAAGVGIW